MSAISRRTTTIPALLLLIFMLSAVVLAVRYVCAATRYPATPRAVTEEYCRLDFNGGQLGGQRPEHLNPRSMFYAGRESMYDTVDVVRSWRITESRQSGASATVSVRYQPVIEGHNGLVYKLPKSSKIDQTFTLKRIDGKWKVVSLLPKPRISQSTASYHMAERTLHDDEYFKERTPLDIRKALKVIQIINAPAH